MKSLGKAQQETVADLSGRGIDELTHHLFGFLGLKV